MSGRASGRRHRGQPPVIFSHGPTIGCDGRTYASIDVSPHHDRGGRCRDRSRPPTGSRGSRTPGRLGPHRVRRPRRDAHGVRHDLVLLDLGLPDIDGVDVCREIRATDPATTDRDAHRARAPRSTSWSGSTPAPTTTSPSRSGSASCSARVRAHLRRRDGAGTATELDGRRRSRSNRTRGGCWLDGDEVALRAEGVRPARRC